MPALDGPSPGEVTTMSNDPKIKLDWSRLLGFDQTSTRAVDPEVATRIHDPRLVKLGPKPTKGIRVR